MPKTDTKITSKSLHIVIHEFMNVVASVFHVPGAEKTVNIKTSIFLLSHGFPDSPRSLRSLAMW